MSKRGEEVNLAYSCIPTRDDKPSDLPPVFMLHGATDNRNTWNDIDQIIAKRTGRAVFIVDARNHGDSDWSDDFNIDVMADDVLNLMRKLKVEKAAFVGHSMGGLAAMNIAHRLPEKVEMIIVEDMKPDIPKEVPTLHFVKILKQCISTVPTDSTESEAQDIILANLIDKLGNDLSKMKRRFLAIHQVNGVWQWKANIDVIIKSLENLDYFESKVKRNVYFGKVLFIYGTASHMKVYENRDNILKYFPKAEFVGIEGALHTIHPHYPQFLTEVLKFL